MHTSRTVELAAQFALIALVVIVALVSTQYDIQQHHRQTQRDLQQATSRLYDSVPTAAGCQRRFYHCKDGAVNTRVFWKLQRLVVVSDSMTQVIIWKTNLRLTSLMMVYAIIASESQKSSRTRRLWFFLRGGC